jgi:hypothetical protein
MRASPPAEAACTRLQLVAIFQGPHSLSPGLCILAWL